MTSEGATHREVAIIGAGPAGLMAAEVISRDPSVKVTVFDAMPSIGRKFLMAGRGGLNLTHSERFDAFAGRYGRASDCLRRHLSHWSPTDVIGWCEGLGEATFVGSSGRVFPKRMKASGLLRAWAGRLATQGVSVRTRHRWLGFGADGRLQFSSPHGDVGFAADATVLALGGASWPRLGSDGRWVGILRDAGIDVAPLEPANCGFDIPWSEIFRERFAGQPIKSAAFKFNDTVVRGEAMITAAGIEGGAIYALSGPLRDAIGRDGTAAMQTDLKPDISHPELAASLARPRGKASMSTHLRKAARLAPVAIGLLQEAAISCGQRLTDLHGEELATLIKSLPLTLTGTAAIAKAISTAGGVPFAAVDDGLMLQGLPGVFVAGEMLDWEAPTGGYLLQACLATGVAAGEGVSRWLATQH